MIKKENLKILRSIRGLSVAITGTCWISQAGLRRLIRKHGGLSTPGNKVNDSTSVLVRGSSSKWKYETHGLKEAKATELMRKGKYIVVVPDYEFKKLVLQDKPARIADTIAGQPIEWLVPPSKETFDNICKIPGALDREYTTKGRLEQSYLRKRLFSGKSSSMCAICGREFPIQLLIAAHIKPRSECSLQEKRDVSNIVFPLCLFGCDTLYERGIVTINNKGYVTVFTTIELTKTVGQYLNDIKGKRCKSWTGNNAQYFRWHYERRF
jgi:hypothetical protein